MEPLFGPREKKDLVKNYILENKIDVCSVQETEIDTNLDVRLLTFPGYSIEVETTISKEGACQEVTKKLPIKLKTFALVCKTKMPTMAMI